MKALEGTKTAENLMKAFAGESQARNRYSYYASIANKEGYKQIANIFSETAENEKEHAKRFFNLLLEGFNGKIPTSVNINATYPVAMGTTAENLKASAEGENEEWTLLYPEFAKIAADEGFPAVSAAFKLIAGVEKRHEARYTKLFNNVQEGLVFKKAQTGQWKCGNCGHIHEGLHAPEKCPACLHDKEYFELFVENY